MFILLKNATDEQFLDAARQWIELFASDRVLEASEFLATGPDTPIWTPQRIKTTVGQFKPDLACYGNESPRITSCADAKVVCEFDDPELDGPAPLVVRWVPTPETTGKYPGRIGEIIYDLPINSYWSSATVIFFIKEFDGGCALELRDFILEDADNQGQ